MTYHLQTLASPLHGQHLNTTRLILVVFIPIHNLLELRIPMEWATSTSFIFFNNQAFSLLAKSKEAWRSLYFLEMSLYEDTALDSLQAKALLIRVKLLHFCYDLNVDICVKIVFI